MKKIKKQIAVSKKDTVGIVLSVEHTHKGIGYVEGDTITVNQTQADWLEETRVGFRAKPNTVTAVRADDSGTNPDKDEF